MSSDRVEIWRKNNFILSFFSFFVVMLKIFRPTQLGIFFERFWKLLNFCSGDVHSTKIVNYHTPHDPLNSYIYKPYYPLDPLTSYNPHDPYDSLMTHLHYMTHMTHVTHITHSHHMIHITHIPFTPLDNNIWVLKAADQHRDMICPLPITCPSHQ